MTNTLPSLPLDTTNLLTAIPAMLGFRPERSLVVVAFDLEASVAFTARHDLLLDEHGRPTDEMQETMADIAAVCEHEGVLGAAVAVVDDRYALDSPIYRQVCICADEALLAAGVPGGVRAGFVLEGFVTGTPWYTTWWALTGAGPNGSDPAMAATMGLDGTGYGCGILGDPQSSPVALERAMRTGRVIMASRDELAESLAPSPHCVDGACGGRPRRGRGSASAAGRAKLLRSALKLLTGPEAPTMTCATVKLLSRAIGALDVRDALLVLAGSEHRSVAEGVWRDLARRTRGETRASAATMLAHLYYLGGEGAYAGVAIDVALLASPSWRLAGLLNTALVAGAHPSMIWDLLTESYSAAAGLGVVLPPLVPERRW